jgi:hypothetical protein
MITSRGNRKPAKADLGGRTGRTRQLRHMHLSMPNDVFPLCISPKLGPGFPMELGYCPGGTCLRAARQASIRCTADVPGPLYRHLLGPTPGSDLGLFFAWCVDQHLAPLVTRRVPLCWAPVVGGLATVKHVPSPSTCVGGRFPCRGERPPEDTEWISTCSRSGGRCSWRRSCLTRPVAAS